ASTPGFRNGGGFRNARWRFRNGLFRRRPDWTWRRLLLLTEQLLTRCPVQHPPSVHRASGPSVFSWCSVPNDNNWLRRHLDIRMNRPKSGRAHAPRAREVFSKRHILPSFQWVVTLRGAFPNRVAPLHTSVSVVR